MKKIMYALLSADKYAALNDRISDAMWFDIGKPTERYAPIVPQLAKINSVYDEDGNETFDNTPVMQITGYVQENYPDTLIGIELVDSYVPYVENAQL